MKALIQRVTQASVSVDGEVVGKCGHGLLIFLGVFPADTNADTEALCRKIASLRIFEDEAGKMNRSVCDIGGGALVVSQFTLCADLSHGNRPSFTTAAPPAMAKEMYESFAAQLSDLLGGKVETGVFGADMKVSLCNDGPATFWLDSDMLLKK